MTATDANGHYEISGKTNGVYRVTPSKVGVSKFAPQDRDAVVAGADAILDDFIAPYSVVLPAIYNMSSVAAGNGVALQGNEPGWSAWVPPYVHGDLVAATRTTDQAGATLSGISKTIGNPAPNNGRSASFELPNAVIAPMTKLRIAWCSFQSIRSTLTQNYWSVGLANAPTSAEMTAGIYCLAWTFNYTGNFQVGHCTAPNTWTTLFTKNIPVTSWWSSHRWCHYQFEIDYAAKSIYCRSQRWDYSADGQTWTQAGVAALPDISPEFSHVYLADSTGASDNPTAYLGGVWIGSGTDAWPAITSWPATTAPWI